MPKAKMGMVTTLKCDRMWGRKTCNWFTTAFPDFKGRELSFRSDRGTELAPAVAVWLFTNRFI